MVSEIVSIFALAGGAFIGLVRSPRQPALQHRLLSLLVAAGLFNLVVLGVSGFLRGGNSFLAQLHQSAGHLMLPLVATAVGLWLGASFPGGVSRRPVRTIFRLIFLLVLGLFCLSNTWTGYLGPSRIVPVDEPETMLRFAIFHRWFVPIVIGMMLVFWLRRLAASRGPVKEEQEAVVGGIA